MKSFSRAALAAALLSIVAAGSVSAARPNVFIIDVSDPAREAGFEADLLLACGFAIDVEATGQVVVHEFDGSPRLVAINNYRMFETFSANGKTLVVRPDSGPDVIWVGQDGHLYIALTGRSVTGSGVVGRTVFDITALELVSVNGHDLGDFIAWVCGELAPPEP
jgi:hypothetical protein